MSGARIFRLGHDVRRNVVLVRHLTYAQPTHRQLMKRRSTFRRENRERRQKYLSISGPDVIRFFVRTLQIFVIS
jgi:hypothetical protein